MKSEWGQKKVCLCRTMSGQLHDGLEGGHAVLVGQSLVLTQVQENGDGAALHQPIIKAHWEKRLSGAPEAENEREQ